MATLSKIVQWSEGYNLGLPEIDDQHRTLVDLINDLWTAIAANKPLQESERILERLEHYTIAHFGAEETMMRTIGYPDFEAHKDAHLDFVRRLQAEVLRIQRGEGLSLDILHFLRDWLVNHIQAGDRAYADYCIASSRPPSFLGRFFSRFRYAG